MATMSTAATAKDARRARGTHRLHQAIEHARARRRSALERRIRDLRQRLTTSGKRKGWRAEALVREVRDAV